MSELDFGKDDGKECPCGGQRTEVSARSTQRTNDRSRQPTEADELSKKRMMRATHGVVKQCERPNGVEVPSCQFL